MSAVPEAVQQWLRAHNHGQVTAVRSTSGGCIHQSMTVETAAGATFFLKVNSTAPEDMFEREAAGLEALRAAGGPKIPQVFLQRQDFLLLEDLQPGSPSPDYWTILGRQLAAVHQKHSSRFGFEHDNYIGSTPQPNGWDEDGWRFFADQRLRYQAKLARDRGYLDRADIQRLERLCTRLPEMIPEQKASLLHGDLWSGNVISDGKGHPALIDPAVYYGWAEADLAMTELFGSLPEECYQAYQTARPLDPGWRSRYPIYNLYHLLNHLNLFGRGYLSRVQGILKRFG